MFQEATMGTLLLIIFHIVAVGAVYVSAYRTGFAVCESNTRRQVEACAAPITEMLERLNLDIESILEDSPEKAPEAPTGDREKAAWGTGRRTACKKEQEHTD
jgi:hypothetical protein